MRPDEFEKLARSPEPAWVAYWRVALSLPGAEALLSDLFLDVLLDVPLDLLSDLPLVLPVDLFTVLLSADAMLVVVSNIDVPTSPDAHNRATNRIIERLLVAFETVVADTAVERLVASAVKR